MKQDVKPWYTSKLIWLGFGLALIPFLTNIQVIMSDNQVSGFWVSLLGTAIVFLRAITTTAVTMGGEEVATRFDRV